MTIRFQFPAGKNERFAPSVATGLIGTTTRFEGLEVPIVDATVPADGSYVELTIEFPGDTVPWPINGRIA